MSALMIFASSGCSGQATVEVNADTKADAKVMVDDFYKGLAESNPVEMTASANGEVNSIFTRDGTKMKQEDKLNNTVFYLFEDNGKKYYLGDNGEPTEEEYTYDFFTNTIDTTLRFLVTAYFTEEDIEGVNYSANRKEVTENGKTTAELTLTISAEQEGEKAEIITKGTRVDDKVTHITATMKNGENSATYDYDFKYDGISITLPEYTIFDPTKYYTHVDSPYATFADVQKDAGEDRHPYMIFEKSVYVITQKDGRLYQLSAEMSDETAQAYEALDFEAEDYEDKTNALLDPLSVVDCIDFTDLAITKETQESYIGKTLGFLMEEGFEQTGYSIWEDGSVAYMEKDSIVYAVDFILPEGFDPDADFEFEDLLESTIKSITFNDVSASLFPLR